MAAPLEFKIFNWLQTNKQTKRIPFIGVEDRFYRALLSALEQIHCAHVSCGSIRVAVAFILRFQCPPKWCTYSAVGFSSR